MSRARRDLSRGLARSGLVACAGVLLAAALGCGDDAAPAPPATQTPAPSPSAEAPGTPPAAKVPPEPPAPAPGPEPAAVAGVGNAEAGAAHYATFCASCHGERGCGDGPLAETLDPQPAKHCDGNVMNQLEDAYLIRVITEGGPAVGKSPMMAPWGGSLDEQQILDVVAFIRSLARPAYSASP